MTLAFDESLTANQALLTDNSQPIGTGAANPGGMSSAAPAASGAVPGAARPAADSVADGGWGHRLAGHFRAVTYEGVC